MNELRKTKDGDGLIMDFLTVRNNGKDSEGNDLVTVTQDTREFPLDVNDKPRAYKFSTLYNRSNWDIKGAVERGVVTQEVVDTAFTALRLLSEDHIDIVNTPVIEPII